MERIKLIFITIFLKVFMFRKDKKYIVCPNHIGETVYSLLFYKKFKENNPNKKLVVVCLDYLGGMCKLFDVDSVISSNFITKLMSCYCVFSNTLENQFVFYTGYHDNDSGGWWQWDTDSVFAGHTENLLHMNIADASYPKISSASQIYIKPNSVLIAPYAKSVDGIPMEEWNNIVNKLILLGYKVYTNTVGDEIPLDNTTAFTVSLPELFYSASKFEIFIGLRSGLCDLLALTTLPMIVITSNHWIKWGFDDFAKSKVNTILYETGDTLTDEVIETIQKLKKEHS